jgi:hypothetical protein
VGKRRVHPHGGKWTAQEGTGGGTLGENPKAQALLGREDENRARAPCAAEPKSTSPPPAGKQECVWHALEGLGGGEGGGPGPLEVEAP